MIWVLLRLLRGFCKQAFGFVGEAVINMGLTLYLSVEVVGVVEGPALI
jgi:hypothetical protein